MIVFLFCQLALKQRKNKYQCQKLVLTTDYVSDVIAT